MRGYIRISLAIILLALVSCHAYFAVLPYCRGSWYRKEAEAKSFEILRNASTIAELEQAVGELGLFVALPDGEWIAIRYGDSHGVPGWSSSVARDSQGKWWTSDRHFCARFESIREYRMMDEESKRLGLQVDPSKWCVDPEVLRFADSQTLNGARTALEELGFQRVEVGQLK